MPFSVWLFAILAIIAAILTTVWINYKRKVKRLESNATTNRDDRERGYESRDRDAGKLGEARQARTESGWAAVVVLAFALFFLAFASVKMVSTKNVGIKTSFGSPSGELSNGLHFTWPWIKVHEMDAAIQTDSYTDTRSCLGARIANQQTACVDVSIRWRIVPGHAPELYKNYRSFDHVRDSLVTRELRAAINQQLASYNPLNSIDVKDNPSGGVNNPTLAQIASRVTKQMRSEIGADIEVINTFIPLITFDDQTQSRINQLQQQIALTRIAEQAEKTAKAQAAANNALAASVSHAPNVLVAQCMDILSTMVKNSQPVPAGMSCWPGNGVAAVIAGSTGK